MSSNRLTTLIIPDGVTSIGSSAFSGCSGVTSVTIPASVTTIGENAFSGVAPQTLVAAAVPSGMSTENLTSVTIPAGCTAIPDNAFLNCKQLSQVTIPESVTEIGNAAFSGCTNWKEVKLPSNLESIGANAFLGVTPTSLAAAQFIGAGMSLAEMTSFALAEGTAQLPAQMLAGSTSLKTLTLPNSVLAIGENACADCRQLETVTIGDGVETIAEAAFRECWHLTSVTLGASVREIGDAAFRDCWRLRSVTLPASVETIGYNAFDHCSDLAEVVFLGPPPTVMAAAFPQGAVGVYPVAHAQAWLAVLPADNQWHGLTMKPSETGLSQVRAELSGEGSVSGTGIYATGSEAVLTAEAAEGYVFMGWDGVANPLANPTTLTVTADTTVRAVFLPQGHVDQIVAQENEASGVVSATEVEELVQNKVERVVAEKVAARELITSDQLQEMAFSEPVMEVKENRVTVGFSLKTANELGSWQDLALNEATIEQNAETGEILVSIPISEPAAFYKFVVPEGMH